MSSHEQLSRGEVLAGLGGRRARQASTLLFLIEARTVHASARAEQLAEVFPTEAAARELDQAYFEAIAQSRELARRPSIQEIERFASAWADLVPPDPALRASVADLFGQRYVFTEQAAPRLRAALGLDLAPVQEAYLQRYGQPLPTIYAPRVPPAARLRWRVAGVGAWLEALPPFWQACVFVLALSFPQAALALSIGMAAIGPIAGAGLLAGFGLLNVLTVAALAEAVARNGAIRYGNAFLGRVAADYLGPAGSVVLTAGAGAFMFLAGVAALVGLATTLASFIGLPATICAAVLFGANAYRLAAQSRVSLSITMLLAGLDLSLLLALSVLGFTHFRPALFRLPDLAGSSDQTLGPAGLSRVQVGVLLTTFYGHNMVSQVARSVLPRDPSGGALIRGSAAAFAIMTLILMLWVLAASGAVAPDVLASTSGTVLVPLAAELGPAAQLLGATLAICLLGLSSIRTADFLFNLARERLPVQTAGTRLGRRGRLVLSISPVLVTFGVAEWLLWTGAASYARLISIAGVLTATLFAGIFPVLLLVASRRKGDLVPTAVYPVLGHPLLVGGVYVVFLGIVLLHGLVIWQEPLERALALGEVVVVLLLTVHLVRRGAFAARAVVELRQESRDQDTANLYVTAVGQVCAARVRLDYADGLQRWAVQGSIGTFSELRAASLEVPAQAARELKVWAHRVTAEGVSEPLPVRVAVMDGAEVRRFDLAARGGQTVVPLTGGACRLELALDQPDV